MKSQLIMIFLFMSSVFYAMDEMTRDESNTICLLNALTYAQHKKDNEIVIFQYMKNSDQKNIQRHDGEKSLQFLQQQLQECCRNNKDDICFQSVLNQDISSENEKTIIYMSQLNLPINHNDGDLWQLKDRFDRLKAQRLIPFIVATDNNKTTEDLGSYLKRQYPDNVIIYFPAKKGYYFTKPFVIVGGIVAMLGLWYFCFRQRV